MEIILSSRLGFCFGVRRAVELVEGSPVRPLTVLGNLIHNPQEIERLKKKGIRFESSVEKITEGTVVISAHGASLAIKGRVKSRGLKIIDATCPFVERLHRIASTVPTDSLLVILGDRNHPEVSAVVADSNRAMVVSKDDDLASLAGKSVVLVSQTTQDTDAYKTIKDRLSSVTKNLVVHETICQATRDNQDAARDTAAKVDMMLVIGGKNSANTRRLAMICEDIVETKHIERALDIEASWFKGRKRVGITAGASTPDWVISEVVDTIQKL
jgi:small subunit ribosomal protein S1